MRGRSAWLYDEELGDVTPDEERGVDGKTEAELEAEFAQDYDRNQREEMSMDYYLSFEELDDINAEREARGEACEWTTGCSESAAAVIPAEPGQRRPSFPVRDARNTGQPTRWLNATSTTSKPARG